MFNFLLQSFESIDLILFLNFFLIKITLNSLALERTGPHENLENSHLKLL